MTGTDMPSTSIDAVDSETVLDAIVGPAQELSSRIGKAVEYMVAAMVVLGTRGTVNASTAMVDDAGVDVTFFNRSGSIDVQIKGRTLDAKFVQAGRFRANVRMATFRPRKDLIFLFVVADLDTLELGPFWLVPSLELAELVTEHEKRGILLVSASTKPDARDKWSKFRLEKQDLPARISNLVSGL